MIYNIFLSVASALVYSQECLKLSNLAAGLGMSTIKVTKLKNQNCCSGNLTNVGEIICTATNTTGKVLSIDWNSFSFSGMLKENLLNQLTSLQSLSLFYSTGLSGPLPTTYPPDFQYFDIENCGFNGSIPTFPEPLYYFFGSGNAFTGPVPAFPSTLYYLFLRGLNVTGNITLEHPDNLDLSFSQISSLIVKDTSQFTKCELQYSQIPYDSVAHLASYCNLNWLYKPTTLYNSAELTTQRSSLTFLAPKSTTSPTVVTSAFVESQTVANSSMTTTIHSAIDTSVNTFIQDAIYSTHITDVYTELNTLEAMETTSTTKLRLTKKIPIREINSDLEDDAEYTESNASFINDSYTSTNVQITSFTLTATATLLPQNKPGSIFSGESIEKLIQNPLFYGSLVFFILFIFSLILIRERQRHKLILRKIQSREAVENE